MNEEKKGTTYANIKKLLISELQIIGGYLLLCLLCWVFFDLFGTPDYIWKWITQHYLLFITGCVSALSSLCGMKKLSFSLLVGTAIGILAGNISGAISVNSSPLRFNSGWMVFLVALNLAAVIGVIIERLGNQRNKESLIVSQKCKKVLNIILTILIICSILISSYSSWQRLLYENGAEAGYQSGLEAGKEDLVAGKPWNSNVRATETPEKYSFGSSGYKGYMNYWPTGYRVGYSNENREVN